MIMIYDYIQMEEKGVALISKFTLFEWSGNHKKLTFTF